MADEEEQDEAAQAFEELRDEVTLMWRAVERLTAERMKVWNMKTGSSALKKSVPYQFLWRMVRSESIASAQPLH